MNNSEVEKNTRVVNASSILREKLQSLDSSDLRALRESGLLSKEGLTTALSMKRGFKRAGVDYRKTDKFKRLLENELSHTAREAVVEGDLSLMAHINGRTSESNSISQFHRIKELQEVLSVQGRSYIFKGEPDTGKTNMALLMAEIWQNATDGTVITNMDSVKQFKTITNFEDWKKEFEKDGEILGIIEDASNHFSGYSVDADMMEKRYRPFSNELAKNDGVIFLLGHTGMDIHADARRKSLLVDKPSLKKTTIYRRIKNGSGADELLNLNLIPKSSVNYDSTEKTAWKWRRGDKMDEKEELEANVRSEIGRLLSQNQEVRTVDLEANNDLVADILRDIAKHNEQLKIDETSPISIKKKTY